MLEDEESINISQDEENFFNADFIKNYLNEIIDFMTQEEIFRYYCMVLVLYDKKVCSAFKQTTKMFKNPPVIQKHLPLFVEE
jgi:hypothetical protein